MCRPVIEGDSAAQTVSGIIWAMPVNIAQLGAHLQAYIETNVKTIRLCHRFGRGDDVHIQKLPVELLEMIIEKVQIPARLKAFKRWNDHFLCFQRRCDPKSHSPDENSKTDKGRSWSWSYHLHSHQEPDPDTCEEEQYPEISHPHLPFQVLNPRCVEQRNRWASFICQCPKEKQIAPEGSFVKYDQVSPHLCAAERLQTYIGVF